MRCRRRGALLFRNASACKEEKLPTANRSNKNIGFETRCRKTHSRSAFFRATERGKTEAKASVDEEVFPDMIVNETVKETKQQSFHMVRNITSKA